MSGKALNKFLLLTIIIFFFFSALPVFGCALTQATDSAKIRAGSKEEFLNEYGKDDSSRAMIEMFFKKRREGKSELLIWPAVGIAATLLIFHMNNSGRNYGMGMLLIFIGLCLIPYAAVAGIFSGTYKLLRFTNRRLTNLLEAYNAGENIPKRIKRNKIFETELEVLRKKPR